MKRSIGRHIERDLGKKLILLSGPRQVGKTTLARNLESHFVYLNYDRLEDRKIIHKAAWPREDSLLILDELHKMKKWKSWLKGIYDTEESHRIIVTGSAKLETYKKMGDPLAGRYFSFRLMRERIGSPFSHNSLKEDLQTDDKTVKRWMRILEDAYILFKVTPYSKSLIGALKKAPKYYFFDIPRVQNEGARFENLVALSLYKEILLRHDVGGENYALHYARNKTKQEIDFLITKENQPITLIEVKLSDDKPSHSLLSFEREISPGKPLQKIQLVKNLRRAASTREGVRILPAAEWLLTMDF